MYKTTLYEASYSDKLNREISRFVSSNTVEILTYLLDLFEDSGLNLKFYFSESYVDSHSRSECLQILKVLRDRMQSSELYDGFTPLQQYILYNSIEGWIEEQEDINPDGLHKSAPKELKVWIKNEAEEPDFIISRIEDVSDYLGVFFDDTDFLEDDIRGFVQAAIHNTERFLD